MKQLSTSLIGGLVILAAGCQYPPQREVERADANRWIARSVQDTAINNAIVRQHTLFPYHFIPNAPDLNDLGRRDLEVLADHFKSYPGTLNVRKGPESEELYRARVDFVRKQLARAGVDCERVPMEDGFAGGEGMRSEWVLKVLERRAEDTLYYGAEGGTSRRGAGAGGGGSSRGGVSSGTSMRW
jgi:uncharacterized membrane protein YgcG